MEGTIRMKGLFKSAVAIGAGLTVGKYLGGVINAGFNSIFLGVAVFGAEKGDEPDRYPDVTRLVHREGDLEKVDFNKVLAEAKSKGYKYSKNAIHNNDYLMKYNDGYFRIGLVDITYGVINEGKEIDVYFNGKNRPITIENDLGIGIVLPIRTDGELEGSVIVEVKGE